MKLSQIFAFASFASLLFVFALMTAFPLSQKEPIHVTLCQLKANPEQYNHKLIQVTGFATHGFENFTLVEPTCGTWPGIWLEFGGTVSSGTVYCCGIPTDRTRPEPAVVEGITTSLVNDANLQAYDSLLQSKESSITRITLVGRFFAGKKFLSRRGEVWGGYGHMGCCTLLAIQQVVSVDAQIRNDLDYSSWDDLLSLSPKKCSIRRSLIPVFEDDDFDVYKKPLQAQRQAERGQRAWSFDDPQRVAKDALSKQLNISEDSIQPIIETRISPSLMSYEWTPESEKKHYFVIVHRPYWLSFYAMDQRKIAWVVASAQEQMCP